MSNTTPYLTCKFIFGNTYNKKDFIQLIRKIPAKLYLSVIFQLSAFPKFYEDIQIRENYISHLQKLAEPYGIDPVEIEKKFNGYRLYTPQGLLAVEKWILAYGDFNIESVDVNQAIIGVLYFCLIVSDFLGEIPKESIPFELVRNAQFNTLEDYGATLKRTLYICTDLAQNKEYYNSKEWVDFNADFEKKYGYTVLEYISIISALFTIFYNMKQKIIVDPFVNIIDISERIGIMEKTGAIIRDMTTSLEDASMNALECLNEDWNFSSFLDKPLLTLDGNSVIPIFHGLLYKNFLVSLKIKIEKCYTDKKAEKFRTFWGRPFEKYVELLMKDSCKQIKGSSVTGEYSYGGNKSPDVLVSFENSNKILAIEAKAKYMRGNSIFFQNDDAVKEELERLIIKPILQVHDRVKELKNIEKIKQNDVYLITVNISGLVLNSMIVSKVNDRLRQNFSIPVKGVLFLSIEEYEFFCSLLEELPKGKSIFHIISKINEKKISFRDYVYNEQVKREKTLQYPKLLENITQDMQERIYMITKPSRIN